ncbi:MAG TPA: hypothetical protein VEF04_09520 [Blastocatellia bacterium]|nr:hypothetical protein [Blastocatellia bacterium]
MSDLRKLQEQYLNDPMFHRLVRSLEHMIESMHLTPQEVRNAAMLAAMNVEQRTVRPICYKPAEPEGDE